MRAWIDTEFERIPLDKGILIIPLSVGITCDDGSELYVVNSEFTTSNSFLLEEVLPVLYSCNVTPIMSTLDMMGQHIEKYISKRCLEFWGFECSADAEVLRYLLSDTAPKVQVYDIKTLEASNSMGKYHRIARDAYTKHNAIEDARWARDTHRHIFRLKKKRRNQ